jgi:Tetratricopeptide repeat
MAFFFVRDGCVCGRILSVDLANIGRPASLSLTYRNDNAINDRASNPMHSISFVGISAIVHALDHTSTLDTVHNLGNLYRIQGKMEEAEQMFERALVGTEKALGMNFAAFRSVSTKQLRNDRKAI